MRRAAGSILLAGGLLGFLGLAGSAAAGLMPFAPFWAFVACAAAMAGLAFRQPAVPEAGPARTGPGPGLDAPLSEGGGTGAGDAGGDGGAA